ncbi:MORN repeat family protein [Neisseria meningitidis 2001001]|uniref:MORN repeat protein n=2 Tax=Neisseria meningitidis TaxID=487 RepID=E0N9S0_NEIM3|nr:MORN repeat protein [Neisseria meningitidis ATCC 13091]EJU53712.1 MORN repeat protein [Neisseria meningitidis NM255]EJU61659.1 MORN repeat protein [Neisseria meningitidis NM2781]EJU76945.1 MORN repeat protein [Neisseria meningitidis NM2795]EJU80552.1 MORN repeat protein [Neisseria meningitidis NM3081]ELL29571.1 MORN repeat family protein [Neisseria meningitidis 77221]EOC12929.1 MORN repeat family protein [Neisseria meningitidis 73696]EOC33250.1 MORN repeat family protein [Neisseria mening
MRCQDGRNYTGSFKNGKFDGQGVYTVAANREIFIEPFNSDSTKFRNMVLSGTFKKGLAHGRFTVSQNGETLFIMKCENGMIKEVKLPKNK